MSRRFAAELLGTAFLLLAVVGSGIMGERLAQGSVGLALLANSVATGGALFALIHTFGPVSGADFNPAVTLVVRQRESALYLSAQLCGAVLGVLLAHFIFELPLVSLSTHVRAGPAQLCSEFVATFGLIAVIRGSPPSHAPLAVALYITGAYWFTSSTSFANPAVTVARALTNTFAGIRPVDVPGFIAAQLAGAVSAKLFFRWLEARP